MSPLPPWLEPLPDAEQQRATDRWAIEQRGIPGVELMERAGAGLAGLVDSRAPDGRVVIVCGKGNNGGDGLVVARLLRDRGRDVDVLLLAAADEFAGDARANLDRLPGAAPRAFEASALNGAAAIVDAIFGTGFSGEPREPARGAIEAINAAAAESVVIACDVPSGVDASTGEVGGVAVDAVATGTFHAGKPGLWIAPGKARAGAVTVHEIGIPDGEPGGGAGIGLIKEDLLELIPRRGRESTKFAVGAVMVCGGSLGLTGAPSLSCEAAMRAGAGYVTALVPASLNIVFEQRLLEVMTIPLPDRDGALLRDGTEQVRERSARADAMVLGPGIGRDLDTVELCRELARVIDIPLLLDADGLNAHAERLESLAKRSAPAVLTPHAGELGRLLGLPSEEIEAHRLRYARQAASLANAVVVLKGDDSIVADPSGPVAISSGGSSALATAGTGDVLSGVIGAYLAKRMTAFEAACAGVLVHARAGRLAAEWTGIEGVIARDVIEALPRARQPG